uniref:Uncharacterized protein LOC114332327 n=1 Tax=Diabrotica virgifera virgifera TaxID=50390 RepID=A0A6P7FNK4_DIAVI
MCRCVWTLFFLSLVGLGSSAPGFRKGMSEEAETSLNKFLKVYLDEVENDGVSDDDLYGKMLGDQPQDENTIHHTGSSTTGESRNITSVEYSRAMRNRNRPNDPDERSRENRIQELKDTILKYIGRKPEDELPNVSVNVTKDLPKFWNLPNISSNDQVTEKIRSFYPSFKKRLSDSKVISETAQWIDLSVKPATKAWSRGRNLGLGVLVEDQEGNNLRANRIFKGTSCTVGFSTPKPIPTLIVDAARQTNELDRIHSLLGRNSTSALHSDIHMLPTLDICTLEFPENYTFSAKSRINACNLKKIYEQSQFMAEKEKMERLASLPDLVRPQSQQRHIRHQRQHMSNKQTEDLDTHDIRSRIMGQKIVLRHEELQNLTHNNPNLSVINR